MSFVLRSWYRLQDRIDPAGADARAMRRLARATASLAKAITLFGVTVAQLEPVLRAFGGAARALFDGSFDGTSRV